jgi:hypothetical protein
MRVQFFQDDELITGGGFKPYMRGQTFDRYQGRRWQRAPTVSRGAFGSGTLEAPQPLTNALRFFPVERLIEQRVFLQGSGDATLFSLYPPMTFGSTAIEAVLQDRQDLALQALEPLVDAVRYTVHAAPATGLPPGAVRRLEWRPRSPRDGPSWVPPTVKAFARELAAQFGDPTDPLQHDHIARRICDTLALGEFEYTLSRGTTTGDLDPIEDFLFHNKRGHCEYFASAMVLLCQSVGIRARLVSGYYAGEFNPVGGFYQFRRKDAHAWVEVHLPEHGWITLDPTPPSDAGAAADRDTLLARAQRLLEFMQFKWATLVVSFDAESRAGLVEGFSVWFGRLHAQFRGGPEEPGSLSDTILIFLWGPEFLLLWQRLFYWLLLVLCTALVILSLRVFWILSLMLREFGSTGKHRGTRIVRHPEAKFYDRLLLLLANKGHVKPGHLTPREFAVALTRTHSDLAPLPEFTEWFYQAQYGRHGLSKDRWERLRTFLLRLREDASFGTR